MIVESLKTSIEGLQLKAVVTINNNGNTETKYCEVGDQVRVVAAQAPEGKKFSHWTVNENRSVTMNLIHLQYIKT